MSPKISPEPTTEQTGSARAELEARARNHAAEVVERWKAVLRNPTWNPTEDEGDFVVWETREDPDYKSGFEHYNGHRWFRETEASWRREQLRAFQVCLERDFSPSEQAIIRAAFPDECAPPAARRWVLLEDRDAVAPIDLPSHEREPERWQRAARAFAEQYRDRLPEEMRHLGFALGLEAGDRVHVALWLGEERTPYAIDAWLQSIDREEPNERFQRLDRTPRECWTKIEPVTRAASLRRPSFTIQSTGVAPLDALLATGGIPRGARVYVQAATGQGKSAFDLHVAEHFAASGLRVVWIATSDESIESINARRLQRVGYARDEATRLALDGDATALGKLNPSLEVLDGQAVYLEDVIASAPDLLVLDPVQKVRTRAGEGCGELERIHAAAGVAEQSGITLLAASSKVRGAGRRSKIESALGGAFIENGATLLLDLTLDGDRLRGSVLKSRYGGAGESFELVLDAERQRLATPPGSDQLDAVVEAIIKALHDRDGVPLALRAGQLVTRLDRAKGPVYEALKRAVELGKVTLEDGKYRPRA
jgi:hypothetical protein